MGVASNIEDAIAKIIGEDLERQKGSRIFIHESLGGVSKIISPDWVSQDLSQKDFKTLKALLEANGASVKSGDALPKEKIQSFADLQRYYESSPEKVLIISGCGSDMVRKFVDLAAHVEIGLTPNNPKVRAAV